MYIDVLSIGTCAQVLASVPAVFGKDVLGVFQMEQRPELGVAFEDDMASAASVAAVRAAFRVLFASEEVHGTCAAFARAAENLHVIDKIG